MTNKYFELKSWNKDKVVFIKRGLFYETYAQDAFLIAAVFGYKLKTNDYSTGFPDKAFLKVKDKLVENGISVLAVDNSNFNEYSVPENKYNEIIPKYVDMYEKYKNIDVLCHKIRIKVFENFSKYEDLKSFCESL